MRSARFEPRQGRLHDTCKRFRPALNSSPHIDSPDHAGCPQRPRGRGVAESPAHAAEQDFVLTSFDDFGLAEPITRALNEEQYATPTPIQIDAIPLVLAGRDVVGIAQTGTGKTAAFALPILNRLNADRKPLEKKSPRVLVLSPTRELSGQILDSFRPD